MDFFKTKDTHCAKSSFCVYLCILAKLQMFWRFQNAILNGLKTFTFKGWSSWKVWIGRVIKSKPTFLACWIISKVTCTRTMFIKYLKVLIKRRNAIHAWVQRFDKININTISKQLVGHPSLGLHAHCDSIFTMVNVVLGHSPPHKNVEIENIYSCNVDVSNHKQPPCFLGIKMCSSCELFFCKDLPQPPFPTCALDSSNSKCGMSHNYDACKVFKNLYKNLQHLLHLLPFPWSPPTFEPLSNSIEGVLF